MNILVRPLLIEDILSMLFHDVSNVEEFLDLMDMTLQMHQVHKQHLHITKSNLIKSFI